MDTKMDDNVRKSWQLESSLVQFQNPSWQTGIEALCKVIADRLGYQRVPIECPLYKLLVYGEGAPSLHEGGDLVVYQNGELKFRHDFGKSDGKAAFFPHYAVHYADAEHALEEVTKGYRLALVYSICLPPTMRHLERPYDQSLSESLAGAISKMEGDDDSFGLLLTHEYTENSIRNLGCGALKGVDSARFHALDGANGMVSKEKELMFFVAQLHHNIYFWSGGDDCEKERDADAISWFTVAGDALGSVSDVNEKFNFLNPSKESLGQLWEQYEYYKVTKEGGFLGNEGSTRITTYTRCAIVAWQKVKHPEKAMKLMPPNAAAVALHSSSAVNGASVKQLLESAESRIKSDKELAEGKDKKGIKLSIEFFRLVCELLVKAGDVEVVVLFFKKYCPVLGGLDENEALVSSLSKIARTFSWSEIGEAMLTSMESNDKKEGQKGGLSSMEMVLSLLDGLDEGAARQALLKMAVEKAVAMEDSTLFALDSIGLLWKWVIRSEDKSLFNTIVKKVSNADTSLVGPSIQCFSQYRSEIGKEKRDEFVPIVVKRVKWLGGQIEALDKTFTWEMPDARLPVPSEKKTKKETDETEVVDKIQTFLRGGDISMTTKGVKTFKHLQDAQHFAAKYWRDGQQHCSFEMEASKVDEEGADGKEASREKEKEEKKEEEESDEESGMEESDEEAVDEAVFVTITKTRDWFMKQQKELVQYRNELSILREKYGDNLEMSNGEKKRARLN